jgi:excisionase family DNA binding protein
MLPVNQARRAYRPEEVGDLLGVSRSTVYRLMGEGVLESVKVGGARRVTDEQLDRYLASLEASVGAA